jgi:hypothetical protein
MTSPITTNEYRATVRLLTLGIPAAYPAPTSANVKRNRCDR